jgi:hypothetical protein
MHALQDNLLQLAPTDDGAGVDSPAPLSNDATQFYACRFDELDHFGQMIFILGQADQECSFPGLASGVSVTPPRELVLDSPYRRCKIEIELVKAMCLHKLKGFPVLFVIFGERVDIGCVEATGAPVRSNFDGGDQIQSQKGQVVQVIGCQLLSIQVGVNQAKATETPGSAAHPADIWKH